MSFSIPTIICYNSGKQWVGHKGMVNKCYRGPLAAVLACSFLSHMKSNKLIPFTFVFFIAIAGILLGCHDKTKELGVIESYKQPVSIEAPESINANDHFSVQITTYGNPCYECGPTEVIRNGNLIVEIVPYDYFTHGKDCPDVPKYMIHSATLSFSVPGTATVSFRGMSELSDNEITENRSIRVL